MNSEVSIIFLNEFPQNDTPALYKHNKMEMLRIHLAYQAKIHISI